MNRTEPQQPAILFLQDLSVERALVETHLAAWATPVTALWPDSADEVNKNDIIALVTVNTRVDTELLAQYPHLQIVSVAFTGYDCVDLEACRHRDIAVCNVPDYATDAVAELTLGLAIALLRKIIPANQIARSGDWTTAPTGTELAGKTVGIVGTGAIGCRTAELFRAFRCRLLGWSRSHGEEFAALGGQYVEDLTDLFARADIVSIHLPLNSDTRGLIGANELNAMKPAGIFINTARGPIVDEAALLAVLQESRIAGAALDVFAEEPLPSQHPLTRLDNVVLTPHIAYRTTEALTRRAHTALDNIRNCLQGNMTNRVR